MKYVLIISILLLTNCAVTPPPDPNIVKRCITDCKITALDCRIVGKFFKERCLKAAPLNLRLCRNQCESGKTYHFTDEKPVLQLFGITLNKRFPKKLTHASKRKDISLMDFLAFNVDDISPPKRLDQPAEYYILTEKVTGKIRKIGAVIPFARSNECLNNSKKITNRLMQKHNILDHLYHDSKNAAYTLGRANTRIYLNCLLGRVPTLHISLVNHLEYSRTLRNFVDNNDVQKLMVEKVMKMFSEKKKK